MTKERFEELVRINGGHAGMAMDDYNAEQIPETDRCKRCSGTGNQLLSMFQCCQACGGDGRSKGNEHQFGDT